MAGDGEETITPVDIVEDPGRVKARGLGDPVAEALHRVADALEDLVELRRRELTGEIRPHYTRAKPREVWIACRGALLDLLATQPFVTLAMVPEDSPLRDEGFGNIYRENQWRRFLAQRAIPNKPGDGSGVALVGLGKANRDGPPAVARRDSLHCAEAAFAWSEAGERKPWKWDRTRAEEGCEYCGPQAVALKVRYAKAEEARREEEAGNARKVMEVLEAHPGAGLGIKELMRLAGLSNRDADRALKALMATGEVVLDRSLVKAKRRA